MMRTSTYSGSLDELETDVLVATLFETETPPRGVAGLVDWRLNGFLSRMIRRGILTGKPEELVLIPLQRRLPARRMLIFGLGKADDYQLAHSRHAAHLLSKAIESMGAIDVAISFPKASDEKIPGDTEKSVFDAFGQAQLPQTLYLRWIEPKVVEFHEASFALSTQKA